MNSFSIIIPVFNESENLSSLLKEIDFSLKILKKKYKFEIIVINDGSNDNSLEVLNRLKNFFAIKIINNIKNYGQSFSLYLGIKESKHKNIITLDGDLQNDPMDIKKLIDLYNDPIKNFKLVGGLRTNRKDNLIKIFSSKIANKVRKTILKDGCNDTGCSLKIFDKDIFLQFPFFNGLHRFLPALFSGYGHKTFFTSVNHRQRYYGISNYGVYNRFFRGIRDIFKVKTIILKYNKNND